MNKEPLIVNAHQVSKKDIVWVSLRGIKAASEWKYWNLNSKAPTNVS